MEFVVNSSKGLDMIGRDEDEDEEREDNHQPAARHVIMCLPVVI